jgi:hypothetical protein
MKKWKMKKHIPRNTVYCGKCKWRQFLGTIKLHKNPPNEKGWRKCEYTDCTKECHSGGTTNCSVEIWRCAYLRMVDDTQESLLWDGCKECGVHYPKDF